MLLHILSPSSEVSNLSFPSIAASTTVGELKTLIRDAVPTKPGPDRQRLIHRGRMLGSDADTLLEVFGQAAVSLLLLFWRHG
ncbi:MAG: hypothetical protein M1832_005038 [Thelocarpon impressellum]|nr:MAG: hypothetical protein M1832_005038 [Thelocarpon impressellum]